MGEAPPRAVLTLSSPLGPRDVPKIARSIGLAAGRASAALADARARVVDAAGAADAARLAADLRATTRQLDAIRAEMRSGMSLTGVAGRAAAAVAAPSAAAAAAPPRLQPLPVSALAAGRVPHRPAGTPSSVVAADALEEAAVAAAAAAFGGARGVAGAPPAAAAKRRGRSPKARPG